MNQKLNTKIGTSVDENRYMNKKIVLTGVLLLVPALLMLILLILPAIDMPLVLLFIGRFHPMLLHFPIVLIFFVFMLEALKFSGVKNISPVFSQITLIAASLSCMIVVIAGYLLFGSGDYSGDLVITHFRGGIFSGIGIFITTYFFFLGEWIGKYFSKLYLGALIVTNFIVIYTSHQGGSLTHGQNYLTEYSSEIFGSNDIPLKPREELLVYEDLIAPFVETKCLSCHNDHKKKGDYLMTSYQALLKGGESGLPAIPEGKPEESELLNRVLLPLDHDDHMPPEGKKPLNEYEIDILKFWVSKGALEGMMVKNITNDSVNTVIDSYLPESNKMVNRLMQTKEEMAKLNVELQAVAKDLKISITQDQESDGKFFALSMLFPPASFTDEDLQELQPYYSVFSKVSLVSSDITDDGLYFLGKMTNLRALYLQKTSIDGSGLVYLRELPFLEKLNLSYTQVNDASVLELIAHPDLKEIYLHNNEISPDVIKALRENQPAKKFLLEEGPYN
ncbi:MAG: putative membrane protein [Bacteroidia bacterium]